MTQLGLALAYLHGEGKLHCDIKPSNVLITDEGHLKLVDSASPPTSLRPERRHPEDPRHAGLRLS